MATTARPAAARAIFRFDVKLEAGGVCDPAAGRLTVAPNSAIPGDGKPRSWLEDGCFGAAVKSNGDEFVFCETGEAMLAGAAGVASGTDPGTTADETGTSAATGMDVAADVLETSLVGQTDPAAGAAERATGSATRAAIFTGSGSNAFEFIAGAVAVVDASPGLSPPDVSRSARGTNNVENPSGEELLSETRSAAGVSPTSFETGEGERASLALFDISTPSGGTVDR
jgi:hypothetical protein